MKTIIFDFYGVIMKDPIGGLMPYVKRTYPDVSLDGVYSHWLKANIGALSSRDFFVNLGYTGDIRGIEKDYLDTLEIDEDFFPFAESLGKSYRMALLTNDIAEWNGYLREKFGLARYLEEIVVSGEVKIKKPDVEIYELILKRLGSIASECIYVDDRKSNLAPAQSLGMDVVLFDNGMPWHDGGKGNEGYTGKMVRSFRELAQMLSPGNIKS